MQQMTLSSSICAVPRIDGGGGDAVEADFSMIPRLGG